jgi:signal peptidase II
MNANRRVFLILLTIACCVCSDQFSKDFAESKLPKDEVWTYAGDTVRLHHAVNKGAVLSFESFLPDPWRSFDLDAAAVVFLGLLTLYLAVASTLRPFFLIALSLVCGGSFSNLLDRLAFGGNKVDFINLGWGSLRTAPFNLADVSIILGLLLLAVGLFVKVRSSALSRPQSEDVAE